MFSPAAIGMVVAARTAARAVMSSCGPGSSIDGNQKASPFCRSALMETINPNSSEVVGEPHRSEMEVAGSL